MSDNKFLDLIGLTTFLDKLKTIFATADQGAKAEAAYTHATSSHAPANAEVNQNAFSNIKVGSTTVTADSKTDTLEIAAGSNVTVTPDATNDKIIISAANTTYSNMTGASTSAAGKAGLVPAPATGAANRYLRSDGTWAVPPDTNTTYSNMTGATSSAAGKAGLVPAPAAGKQTSFLRGDGTWAVPTDTKYTLSSFGITATATELNYTDGVTSNIQTQLNGKAASSHTHNYAGSSSAGGAANSATKLATARTIRTNLGSTSTASFDGTANITPGVTGTLGLANGGTGATTAAAARSKLGFSGIVVSTSEPTSQNTNEFWLQTY